MLNGKETAAGRPCACRLLEGAMLLQRCLLGDRFSMKEQGGGSDFPWFKLAGKSRIICARCLMMLKIIEGQCCMRLKDPGVQLFYLNVLCSLGMVIVALFLHRLALLFSLTFIFISILILIWGAPFIVEGIKELQAARKVGEKVSWQSNKSLVKGLSFIFPCVLPCVALITTDRFNISAIGNHGILFEIIKYFVAFVVLFPLLVLLIGLTIATIRYILTTPHPYVQYIQDAFFEEQSSDK